LYAVDESVVTVSELPNNDSTVMVVGVTCVTVPP